MDRRVLLATILTLLVWLGYLEFAKRMDPPPRTPAVEPGGARPPVAAPAGRPPAARGARGAPRP